MEDELKYKNIRRIIENKTGFISDGYHTFNELYFHRMILFSVICNQNKDKAWKSKLHADGTMFPGYFIVGIDTPDGKFSYHYKMECWDEFKDIDEYLTAPPWDGHESSDVLRLRSLYKYKKEGE